MKSEKFEIQGMTCSACQAHVQKAVSKLEGIKNVNVNLLSNNMQVEFDEEKTNEQAIIQSVIQTGYGANVYQKNQKENKQEKILKMMKRRLIISVIFLIPLMYLAMYHMFYEWFGLPIPKIIQDLFHGSQNAFRFCITQLILLLPIVIVNRNYFIVGFKKLFTLKPNMDSLIAIGSTAAIVYGFFAMVQIWYGMQMGNFALISRYNMDIYFESAGTILTLITLGKFLETKSKGKTSQAISKLINLTPKTAIILKDQKEISIAIEEVRENDIIILKPGNSVPVDGEIIEGASSIDESMITGESIPVEKKIGEHVIAGTINKTGYLKIKATKVGENTTLAEIIRLVEEASNSKAPISKLADRVSAIFVPIVITIAILAVVIWLLLGQSIEFAISIGIAVLVISCPCALGLATPVAIMVGTGKAAEYGILIKTAEALEELHNIKTIIFDKTGTVTKGKPVVTDILLRSERNEKKFLQMVGSLEKASEHSLAEAIVQKVEKEKISFKEVKEFLAISGRGIKGKIEDNLYIGGNQVFMEENGIVIDEKEITRFAREGKTSVYFAKDKELLGIILIADEVKETSKEAIEVLQKLNLQTILLTGDHELTAKAIAEKIGIKEVIAGVLPKEKEQVIANIEKQGRKVAFVGDGINDSPALARSNVGIAIGSGTDIAIESADIVLMKNDLLDVVTAIQLSKAVIKNIKMNLFWAFFYNTIGIPIATGVLYQAFGLKLNPMFAALAMSLSSVCVVANALRLRNFKGYSKNVFCKLEKKRQGGGKKMTKTISVEGMMCAHCQIMVEKTLNQLEGVENVVVDLDNKIVTVTMKKEIEDHVMKTAIEEAGYKVTQIK